MFVEVTLSLLKGFLSTVELFALTLLFALPLGLLIGLGEKSKIKVISLPLKFIIWVIRGTPLMLQLLLIFYGPGILFGYNVWGGNSLGRFVAALVAFVINYSCYFAEIYRGGIQSIPVGQYEAAEVLGYTKTQTFMRIILPQVIKIIMPSVTNEVITLVKDTSLAFTLAYAEVFSLAKQISASQSSFMPFLIAGVFYFVANYVVEFLMVRIEKSMDYYK